jgi:hypothetical protein
MTEYFGSLDNTTIQQRLNVRSRIEKQRVKAAFGVNARTVTKSAFRSSKQLDKRITPTNIVEIPEKLIAEVNAIIDNGSKEISSIMLKEGLATLLAYRHSVLYTGVVVRDGLKMDPPLVE